MNLSDEAKNIIQVKNLTKKFGNFTAVDGISFFVEEGEIFAFLGPNGAGKTTTIKMLTTLLHPNSGEIEVNGFNPLTEQNNVRCSFGIVFQDPSLDEDLTAYENLELHGVLYKVPKDLRQKRIEDLLKFVELWEKRNNLVKTFSGGMRRRLEIARGFIHHPKILFLDEPTIGLDPQTRKHIWDYIQNLNQTEKITVFMTTQYIEEAEKIAGRVAIIDDGKIVINGTSEEVKKKTKTKTLEEAFLSLTGHGIRNEEAGSVDRMRMRRNVFHRR